MLKKDGKTNKNSMNFTIFNILKNRLNKPNESYEVSESGIEHSNRQFRFENLQDNIYEPMGEKAEAEYKKGSGNELNGSMKTIYSSSAMTYNIFRNENAIFEGVEYGVSYEKQFYTLNEKIAGKPANLDAFLESEDGGNIIACEMKMTEWFASKKIEIKPAYLEKESYQKKGTAEIFLKVIENLSGRFGENMRYDAMQMFKHSLALYNACASGKISPKKLTLINCVWEVPFSAELPKSVEEKCCGKLMQEHEGFGWFYKAIEPIKMAFFDLGIEFEVKYYGVHEFVDKMTLNDKVRAYLSRYTK
ncbi:MAG: hypothetical protein R3Y32_09045 [Bacillota bacterium]